MRKIAAVGLGITLASALAAARMSAPALHAADKKKEEYVSTAAQKTLLNKPLHGVDGKQVSIIHATLPPGWVGGKHHHTGPLYVYVLEGSFTVDEQGKPRQIFKTGELYEEPIQTPMQARNLSTSEATKILLFQVHGHGEPLMYKSE